MATANHYLLDAVAGAVVVLAGHAVAARLAARVDLPTAEPLPFGVGEIPADCAELDHLYCGGRDDADCLPVAV
jgi:hypothetical protein